MQAFSKRKGDARKEWLKSSMEDRSWRKEQGL